MALFVIAEASHRPVGAIAAAFEIITIYGRKSLNVGGAVSRIRLKPKTRRQWLPTKIYES